MIYNWPDIDLSEFQEAKAFAGGKLRGNVADNEVDHATLTEDGYLKFKIDYDRNAKKAVPSYRVEFTEWPWLKRFTAGTLDVYEWKYRFPENYKKALTPVSIFQMYCRWETGGAVMCQLELARPGQIKNAYTGQLQMIYNAGPEKYRALTPFIPEPGDELDIRVTCKHGIDGYLKVEINKTVVFDRLCNTVFLDHPEASAQAKWGIYHHGLKGEEGPVNNQLHLKAGHRTFELEMSPLTINRNAMKRTTKTTKAGVNYFEYMPVTEPKGVILFFHGLGEVGNGMEDIERNEIPKLFKNGIEKPYIVLAPDLPSGKGWPKNLILSMISEVESYGLKVNIVTGLSLGGMATISALYHAYYELGRTDIFTAAAVICGKTGATDMSPFMDTPIRWFHGVNDSTISVNNARAFTKRLKEAGGTIDLIEYTGMGHNIWGKAYNDEKGNFWDWISQFDKVEPVPDPVETVERFEIVNSELFAVTSNARYKTSITLTKE